MRRQKITAYGEEDRDIIAVAMDESLDLREQDAVVQVFFMRSGRMIGQRSFLSQGCQRGYTFTGTCPVFMKQFYAGTPFIPREIMLQTEIEDREMIEEWLSSRRKQKGSYCGAKEGYKRKA